MDPEVDKVKKVDETKAAQGAASASSTAAAAPTVGAASSRAASGASDTPQAASTSRTGELDPGKSTVKGDTDYFDGKSVITDADTVVDIATIMKDHKASNMKPEQLADYLREKGYDVKVVQMGNRKAVQFPNGDYFVDSDGDGNLGTKDQNFQNALTQVEQKFGVDLSALKAAKELQIYRGGGGDKGGVPGIDALMGMDALGGTRGRAGDLQAIFAQLDGEMAAKGYDGVEKAQDLWRTRSLSPVLEELDIPEPELPDPSVATLEPGIQQGLDMFMAAYSVARSREALGI